MKAIGYIRVSTDHQAEMYGTDYQREEIQKYADENGYEIVQWKIEVGSGAKRRPVIEEIVYGGITNPPIDALIVFKNDRVAREPKLYYAYMFHLETQGIKLLSTQESWEDDPYKELYMSFSMFLAKMERQNITIRTSMGRRTKAKAGGYSGGRPPYGYRAVNGKLEIDEYEAEVVREVYAMLDTGIPYRTIADNLNAKGYRSRYGKDFHLSNIQHILKNKRLYEGMYKYGENDWIEGAHEAII